LSRYGGRVVVMYCSAGTAAVVASDDVTRDVVIAMTTVDTATNRIE